MKLDACEKVSEANKPFNKTNGTITEKNANELIVNKMTKNGIDSGNNEDSVSNDLLIEDTNDNRNGKTDSPISNGNKADDTISLSSSSSNIPNLELEEDISEESMTLRLSEDEDEPPPVQNEKGIFPYMNHSSPLSPESRNVPQNTSDWCNNLHNGDNTVIENGEISSEKADSRLERSDDLGKPAETEKLKSDGHVDAKESVEESIADLEKSLLEVDKIKDTSVLSENFVNSPEKNCGSVGLEPSVECKKSDYELVSDKNSENSIPNISENSNGSFKDTSSEPRVSNKDTNENKVIYPEKNENLNLGGDELEKGNENEIKSEDLNSVDAEKYSSPGNKTPETLPPDNEKLVSLDDDKTKKPGSLVDDDNDSTKSDENLLQTINEQIENYDCDSKSSLDLKTINNDNSVDSIADKKCDSSHNKDKDNTGLDANLKKTENVSSPSAVEQKQESENKKDAETEPMDIDDSLLDKPISDSSNKETSNEEPQKETEAVDKSSLMEVDNDKIVEPVKSDSETRVKEEDLDDKKAEGVDVEPEVKEGKQSIKKDFVESDEGIKEEDEAKGYSNVANGDTIEAAPTLKRALEKFDDPTETKKLKMNGLKKENKPKEYVSMDSFREFMNKKVIKQLTRAELEEFTLQKMCETINQRSEIGELRHQVMKQSQMIDSWRIKVNNLSKQTRDLEVVNFRMLQEVRAKIKEGGNVHEATPVKITRSVGLQVNLFPAGRVRMGPGIEQVSPTLPPPLTTVAAANQGAKRKMQRASLPTKLPILPPSPSVAKTASPGKAALSPSNKSIKTILPKVLGGSEVKEILNKSTPNHSPSNNSTLNNSFPNISTPNNSTPNNSLLAGYLSNQKSGPSPSQTSPAVRKTADAAKVIDLTDEDDTIKNTATISPATSTPGNIRVVSSHHLTNGPVSVNTNVSPLVTTSIAVPRLTYLLPTQGQPGQQLILTTSAAPTRPGQPRQTIMLKNLQTGQVTTPTAQRLSIVRPGQVPAQVNVVPSGNPSIRPQQIRLATTVPQMTRQIMSSRVNTPHRHPAPLPASPAIQPSQPTWKLMPPKPSLKISRVGEGIVLSWKMVNKDMSIYEDIASYQLYAYQETNAAPSSDMWRKVGDVKALALPMACTLTQFTDGNKYHFAVRAVDVRSRVGPFSQPEQIALP